MLSSKREFIGVVEAAVLSGWIERTYQRELRIKMRLLTKDVDECVLLSAERLEELELCDGIGVSLMKGGSMVLSGASLSPLSCKTLLRFCV